MLKVPSELQMQHQLMQGLVEGAKSGIVLTVNDLAAAQNKHTRHCCLFFTVRVLSFLNNPKAATNNHSDS